MSKGIEVLKPALAVGGMGGAADAALVFTMFTVGGMLADFIFAKFHVKISYNKTPLEMTF
ncbi:MAG: hypothetical protein JJE18_09470 [Eubacteriaceae bacterium]|nr:hypothetical protein [Eubacteriaceae bacterium]